MKSGSMGEIPPRTRRTRGCSAFTASDARLIICAKIVQPGSISKFQCERLLGSFQSITASTMRASSADVNLVLRLVHDGKTRTAQHRLHTGTVGDPPVRGIVRVAMLHKIHLRISGLQE